VCAVCSIDFDSAATAETLRELQDVRRARDVRVSELSIDPALVSGDEATVSMTVRLDLSECRGPGGWHEARVRHYLASLRQTEGAWRLRTLIWREEMLAIQLVAAKAEDRAPLLAANPDLVGGELARALYRRGLALVNSATPGAAESIAALALDIARRNNDRGAVALAIGLQAIVARKQGLLDLSTTNARESLSIAQESEDPDVLARAWTNLARTIKVVQDHSSEEKAAQLEARRFAERAVDSTLLIRVLENLGVRHLDLGENVAARQYCGEVLRLSQAAGDVPAQITSCINLAFIYQSQLDFELALRYATRGRDLAEATRSFFLDSSEVLVANIQTDLANLEAAEVTLLRVIQAPRDAFSDHDAVVKAKETLAFIYLTRGDESEAECLTREAATSERREHPARAWLGGLSEHALDRGNARRALALSLEEAAFGSPVWSPRAMARGLTTAGRAYRKLGMIAEARSCFAEAVEFHEETMRQTTGTEEQQVRSAEEAAAS
jgi:tetratricopeptide (TPR) repeat protein